VSLLERGAINDEKNTKEVRTAFLKAAECGHLPLLMRLCENQTPVDYDARVKALQQTSEAGHVKIVEFLLTETSPADSGSYRAIDFEAKNKALGIALENGQLDVAKLLLKHDAALDGVVFIGSSPLHVTAALCKPTCYKWPLSKD
jgi:ankyrin repeat protein